MKLSICAFLIKENLPENYNILIDAPAAPANITIGETPCEFYSRRTVSEPKWVKLFNEVEGINTQEMRSSGVQGLLKLTIDQRVFCLTFGHARHMIDPMTIERNFGLKVTLGLTDPDLIKSIDKTNIDRTPFRSRTQATKYVSLSDFAFKFDWEILKSLTGIVQQEADNEDYELVSGSDSVFIHTDIAIDQIPALCSRLLEAYHSEEYKQKFPWIDYIIPIRDINLLEALNNELIFQINAENYNDIWIAPPLMINHDSFHGFCYKNRTNPVIHPDLSLSQCLTEKRIARNVTHENIRSQKILMMDENATTIDSWPIFLCLNANITIDENLYLLSEGDWYQIDQNFKDQVETYFNQLPRSQIQLPSYTGRTEPIYLNETADGQRYFLLDRKLVRPDGVNSGIEFCDLLTHENHLIHVKKYSASSTLSHLFSQGFVSAELLLRSPEIINQVNAFLTEQGYQHTFVFNPRISPRTSKIIYAIMQPGAGALHLPFFSKVNLKQFAMRLNDMGFDVELKKIEI